MSLVRTCVEVHDARISRDGARVITPHDALRGEAARVGPCAMPRPSLFSCVLSCLALSRGLFSLNYFVLFTILPSSIALCSLIDIIYHLLGSPVALV
jgi:hypothetical protein